MIRIVRLYIAHPSSACFAVCTKINHKITSEQSSMLRGFSQMEKCPLTLPDGAINLDIAVPLSRRENLLNLTKTRNSRKTHRNNICSKTERDVAEPTHREGATVQRW